MLKSRWTGVAAAVLLASSMGCATNADLTALQSEMAETRRIAEDAQRQAAQAAADAARAEAKAQEAADKADRIFQKTLRK